MSTRSQATLQRWTEAALVSGIQSATELCTTSLANQANITLTRDALTVLTVLNAEEYLLTGAELRKDTEQGQTIHAIPLHFSRPLW